MNLMRWFNLILKRDRRRMCVCGKRITVRKDGSFYRHKCVTSEQIAEKVIAAHKAGTGSIDGDPACTCLIEQASCIKHGSGEMVENRA